jgi:hypothetical protein
METEDLVVAGVYVPVIRAVSLTEKRRFWAMLHDAASGKRRNLGTFNTRVATEKHERAVQSFKRGG